MIYFDIATKRAILGGMAKILSPDGLLFLGSTETIIGITDCLQRRSIDGAVCYMPRA